MRTDKEILLDLINLVEEHNQNTIQRETVNNDNTFGIPNSFIDKANSLVVQEDQLDVLQEECGELIQACSKVLRDKPKAFDSLKEEMAHVLISAAMVAKILGITQADIDLEVKKKADKFVSPLYKCEKKVDRDILFEKYKERARKAYEEE